MATPRPVVLSVIDALSGGAGILAVSTARGTPSFEHHICELSHVTSYGYGCLRQGQIPHIPVVRLNGYGAAENSALLRALIRDLRPDLVLHHWWRSCHTSGLLSDAKEANPWLRVVLISHTNDPSPSEYDYYVSVSHANSLHQLPHIRFDKHGNAINHAVIRNAVDFDHSWSTRTFSGGASVRLGSLQPFKVEEDWVTFVSSIGPPHTMHFLVGQGPLLRPFRDEASDTLMPAVIVTGPVDHGGDEFRWVMERSDVFLQESVKPEAGSLAVLEALSAGIPVVANRGGCLEEFVEQGVTGILTNSRAEFRESCIELLSDRSLWRRLSGGCRERAREYTLSDMLRHYRSLMSSLLGSY